MEDNLTTIPFPLTPLLGDCEIRICRNDHQAIVITLRDNLTDDQVDDLYLVAKTMSRTGKRLWQLIGVGV